ncbi:hypothetical protein F3Y22_tig00109978pilonHSYRG00090 [Hibiscus syriacus]|uniref:RNase H type-1 domain-containing protein n=1 Tax=Hibiscus syriacus TaxID=106335 RepID=A0A6A3BQ58_HIBSY|nr:hypothetical protein F3Y22_tig00109978pilonHSYRG00090 [Hibiscus syriacus]
MVAQEVIHSMRHKRGKTKWMAIKVDLEKAYDRFGRPQCKSSGMAPLRKNLDLPEAFAKGLWEPMILSCGGPSLSHIFFADDLVLFCRVNQDQAALLKSILVQFSRFSGHRVNSNKTRVFFLANVETTCAGQWVMAITSVFGLIRGLADDPPSRDDVGEDLPMWRWDNYGSCSVKMTYFLIQKESWDPSDSKWQRFGVYSAKGWATNIKKNHNTSTNCSRSNCRLSKWKKLMHGCFKLNTDEAMHTGTMEVVCGGVIRDHTGAWVADFSRSLSRCTTFQAELWTVMEGLEIAWNMGVRVQNMELDNQEAATCLNSDPQLTSFRTSGELEEFSDVKGKPRSTKRLISLLIVWLDSGTKGTWVLSFFLHHHRLF